MARAWRGLYAIFWFRLARAWRGHGAGVARACPVTPGVDGLGLWETRCRASHCVRRPGWPGLAGSAGPAGDLYPIQRKMSWVHARSAIAGWIGLNQVGHGWPGILRIHATHATHATGGTPPLLVQIFGVGPRAGPCPWDGPG
eukprot:gene24020-biopygen7363